MNNQKFITRKQILLILGWYFLTPILYNLLVVMLNEFLFMKVTVSKKEIDLLNQIFEMNPIASFQRISSFFLPSVVGVWYTFPIWKDLFTNNLSLSNQSRVRIVNSALFSGIIGFLGWLIGLLNTLYMYSITPELNEKWLLKQSIYFLFEMILCFSLVYYTLDYFNRNYVFPKILSEHEILELKGKISLKISQIFFIYFFTSVIMPVTFLFGIIWKLIYNRESELYIFEIIFSLLFILSFSGILTYYVTQSIIKPISKLKEKAFSIQEGDFQNPILVNSTDEIGELTKTINQMSISLQEKEKMKDLFGRAVDPKIRDLLISNKIQLGGEIQNITVVFCDIRGFTSISEKLEPKKVVFWLNQYFQKMEECITKQNGVINKFIGDAILAIFGAPIFLENHSLNAVKCALEMKNSLAELNEKFLIQQLPEMQFGIGIHTGNVLVGSVGSFSRSEYTVIGDTVNIASRVESLCKEYNSSLLFTENVKENIFPYFENVQFLAKVQIRGRQNQINLYTLKE